MARTTKRPAQAQNPTAKPQPIPIPATVQPLLADLIARRDAVMHELSLVLTTLGATLGVPAGWTIRSVDEGFVPAEVAEGPARAKADAAQ